MTELVFVLGALGLVMLISVGRVFYDLGYAHGWAGGISNERNYQTELERWRSQLKSEDTE